MKKNIAVIAVLLVLAALSLTFFVHAGDLPQIPLNSVQDDTIPEVSTDYEVPISLEDPTTALLRLSAQTLQLNYKATKKLTVNAADVTWTSSNEKVVQVDQNGTLTATGRGTARVTATAKNGSAASCTVTVRYTVVQWIIVILLFGWIWY